MIIYTQTVRHVVSICLTTPRVLAEVGAIVHGKDSKGWEGCRGVAGGLRHAIGGIVPRHRGRVPGDSRRRVLGSFRGVY